MKPIFYAALIASVATFTVAKADSAPAAISIVKQSTLEQSNAFKDIVRQLEGKRKEIQEKLAKDEKNLKKEDEKLAAAQKKLSAEAFAKERQKFEALVNNVRLGLERKKIQMELAFEESKKKVYEEFLKIVEAIRKEKGGVVFYAEAVAAAAKDSDISEKVLTEMNKNLKEVKVTFKSDEEIKKLIAQQVPAK